MQKLNVKHISDLFPPKGVLKHLRKPAGRMFCAFSVLLLLSGSSASAAPAQSVLPISHTASVNAQVSLQSQNWEPTVKDSINEFFSLYGNRSSSYNSSVHPYAIFDFDNTTSIMDVEEQLIIWQLDHLAFAIPPDQMETILQTGIPQDKLNLTYGADDGDGRPVRISDAIHDAAAAYRILYDKGLVTLAGHSLSAETKNSAEYQEFTAKMRWLYDAIGETMDTSVSYPWVTYWFTGMTPDQVYRLAYSCDNYYGNPKLGQTWTKGKYTSPASLGSQAGSVTVSYKNGITVTPEVKELYHAMARDGIDPWINSASPIDAVRAAVAYFHIPDVKGIVAMTNKTDSNGKYINVYDYDFHPQTQGVGKAVTISKIIAPKYQGHGPIFCAMDSQGDFNFCTEFKDTKVVLIMNRKRTDDAALCAGIAAWQKSHGITVAQANQAGDTKFLLQGRNENKGQLWPTDQTLLLGKTGNSYLSDRAKAVIGQLDQGVSISQVLKEDTKLKNYQGYKTR